MMAGAVVAAAWRPGSHLTQHTTAVDVGLHYRLNDTFDIGNQLAIVNALESGHTQADAPQFATISRVNLEEAALANSSRLLSSRHVESFAVHEANRVTAAIGSVGANEMADIDEPMMSFPRHRTLY